jgi:hypothetical protein
MGENLQGLPNAPTAGIFIQRKRKQTGVTVRLGLTGRAVVATENLTPLSKNYCLYLLGNSSPKCSELVFSTEQFE